MVKNTEEMVDASCTFHSTGFNHGLHGLHTIVSIFRGIGMESMWNQRYIREKREMEREMESMDSTWNQRDLREKKREMESMDSTWTVRVYRRGNRDGVHEFHMESGVYERE